MDPESPRWKRITASGFAWEREALDYLCSRLPDEEPYRAWANFEFITTAGTIYEVDVALLTPRGFFVVEIKSWRGELTGDSTTWTGRVDGGRPRVVDNPLLLTNRKAKTLKSLLANTPSGRKLRGDFPFVEPLVFLSSPGLKVDLDEIARTGVFGRGGAVDAMAAQPAGRGQLPGIVGYLTSTDRRYGRGPARPITSATALLLTKAMDEAGIRLSRRSLRAGDYELKRLLTDGPGFQDFEATHVQLPSVVRRVRVYGHPRGTSAEEEASRRRAAEREAMVLEGLQHPGVLAAKGLTSHELGPALVFEHDPQAKRLDHWLTEHGDSLSLDTRINIVRQLVDALRYAHGRRVAHRALEPRSILVGGDPSAPVVKVFSWQTAGRTGSSNGATGLPFGTSHLDALVDEEAGAYLAPEALTNPDADATALDVFSLGAVAYLVLTGQPPAANGLELLDVVRAGNGLQLPSVLDGVGERLRELVAHATCPDVVNRYDTVDWLALDLDEAQRELLPPDQAEEVTHPADARPGDRLGPYEVRRQIGKGSTAVALLVVDEEGSERVLKVALDEGFDESIRDEAAVLDQLTHQNVVRSHGLADVPGDRATLALAKAGDTTLARFLREEGSVGVDMLQRWGNDLLGAVVFLEDMGSAHRDIKPDNLGIVPVGRNEERHLVLFDFSLSRAALTNIRAGTPPYLEPFLVDRPGRRWDTAAERYAAAVTLYEMATGTTPTWGDGRSDPASVPGEATIEGDRFPSSVRDGMVGFFAKALRRAPKERFDTADEMRRAWAGVFAAADAPAATTTTEGDDPVDFDALVCQAGPGSPLAELGLSQRTLDVLERMDVLTVTDLVRAPERSIRTARAVANKVRRQILDVRAALRRRFPDLAESARKPRAKGRKVTTSKPTADAPTPPKDVQSLDLLVPQLVPTASRSGARQGEVVQIFLGLDQVDPPRPWRTQAEVAAAAGMTAARVSQIVSEQRPRWGRNRSLRRLRDEVDSLVRGMGGVGTAAEVAEAIASLRGVSDGDADPAVLGSAAVRAACEVEADATSPRWVQRRSADVIVLALASGEGDVALDEALATARADWAVRLGRAASQLAGEDSLPSPATVLARLRGVTPPDDAPLLPDGRLVRFAAAMTDTAAVSARLELYPRGLDCRRAIRLAQNALLVPASRAGGPLPHARLSVGDVEARLRSRYPDMAPLPPRPLLDDLLREADVPLEWEEGDGADPGGYVMPATRPAGLTSMDTSHRSTTGRVTDAEAEAVIVATDERLAHAATAGGFLALTVRLGGSEAAAAELGRFGVQRVSIEARLLVRLHEQADAAQVEWAKVIEADAGGPESPDWRRLLLLMERAWPVVDADVRAAGPAVLLTELGPLARYQAMSWIEAWRDAPLDPASGLRTVWLLVPSTTGHDRPTIDGSVVPMIGDGQWARLPRPWLETETTT